jgi:fructokinase
MFNADDLTLQVNGSSDRSFQRKAVIVGEVLWDVFPDSACLGGAPLNFAVHASRLGLQPILLSAVGDDELGDKTVGEIAALGLNTSLLQRSSQWGTGTAIVAVDEKGQPEFRIPRPAAYDDYRLTPAENRLLRALEPSWIYYGTLFPSTAEGRTTLRCLLDALPNATRFYDVNLRHGFDSLELVAELLAAANIVKLNETEAEIVGRHFGLPRDTESFCRAGTSRFGWRAVCVTLGEQGCAVFDGTGFARAAGETITVVDTVGAGDAFAAAFVHGLSLEWPAREIARFANRVGALVASRAGAIPDWNIEEAVTA